MQNVIDSFSFGAADRKRDFADRFDRNMDKARFGRRRDEGKFGFRSRREDVHKEIGGKAVRDIERKIEVVLRGFSVFVCGDLPAQGIDKNVDGFEPACYSMPVCDVTF